MIPQFLNLNIPTSAKAAMLTHPIDVAALIGLIPFGVVSLLAQALPGVVPNELNPWLQLGGSAALIVALVVAVKYQTARNSDALNEIKHAHEARVADLSADKDYYRKRCEALQQHVLDCSRNALNTPNTPRN